MKKDFGKVICCATYDTKIDKCRQFMCIVRCTNLAVGELLMSDNA